MEYTPTQVVSEFIKLRFKDHEGNAVDGVLYPSSRREGGRNVVLFVNQDNIEGIPREPYSDSPKLLRLIMATTNVIEDRIRKRAYALHVQRGRRYGFALKDWLDAEDEILGREPGN